MCNLFHPVFLSPSSPTPRDPRSCSRSLQCATQGGSQPQQSAATRLPPWIKARSCLQTCSSTSEWQQCGSINLFEMLCGDERMYEIAGPGDALTCQKCIIHGGTCLHPHLHFATHRYCSVHACTCHCLMHRSSVKVDGTTECTYQTNTDPSPVQTEGCTYCCNSVTCSDHPMMFVEASVCLASTSQHSMKHSSTKILLAHIFLKICLNSD